MDGITGVVKSFGLSKGYGFIESEAIEGDIFFSKSSLPSDVNDAIDGRCFDLAGREVTFAVEAKEGKTQAHGVQLVPREGQPLVGKVKSYSPNTGYGFIGAEALSGQDVFFMKTELPQDHQFHCSKGTPVSFCIVQTQEGKIQAQGIRVAKTGGTGSGQGAVPDFAGMDPTQLGLAIMSGHISLPALMNSKSSGGLGSSVGSGLSKRPATGTTMSGIVKSFNLARGWGFITAPGCAGDVYFKCNDSSIADGMQVEFTVTTTQDGKVQGKDVTPGLPEGSQVTGTVKSYNPQKGFGFLRVPGRAGDVHFRKQSLPANMQDSDQLEGQNFQFSIHFHQGKMQANDLQYGAGSGYIAPAMGNAQKRGASPLGFTQAVKRQKLGFTQSTSSALPALGGNKMQGVVKSFNPSKGYGFINADGMDIYFKGSSLPSGHIGDLVGSMVIFGYNTTTDGKVQAAPGIQVL